MSVFVHMGGVAALLAAALLVQLATRRQTWRREPLPAVPALTAALILALLAGWGWAQVMMVSTAIFVTLTMAMLALSVVPALAVLRLDVLAAARPGREEGR